MRLPIIHRKLCILAIMLGTSLVIRAQDDAVTLDDLTRSAEQWAKENLDADALRVLQRADQQQVKQFFAEIQKQFQGEYVIDLASLRESAKVVLPLLERYEETLPYALWLKSRLDDLEVAEQLRLRIPPPKPEPGRPPKPIPNPSPQLAREVWIKKLADGPWPKAAKPYITRLTPI